jgi:hypothetical protein
MVITKEARVQAPNDKNKSAEIKKVEQTLRILLDAIERHRRPSHPDDGHIYSFKEAMALGPYYSFERDPIGHSLREGVTKCGEWLWNLTRSTDKMRDSLYRVAGNNCRRMDIMDKWWNGIGKWFA